MWGANEEKKWLAKPGGKSTPMLLPGPETCQQVTSLERTGKPDKGSIYASPPDVSLIPTDFLTP